MCCIIFFGLLIIAIIATPIIITQIKKANANTDTTTDTSDSSSSDTDTTTTDTDSSSSDTVNSTLVLTAYSTTY